ncbi:MAG TPA: twin-arginine translocase TatA/TatE family subunit [Candidatus Saccharimonadales bacterium]|jgi:sec-independent protein translocase protein TatA|nr:twin-arginine translocase TatA/TatE family subunit [Candidatus Saccharimonadales bacterium]
MIPQSFAIFDLGTPELIIILVIILLLFGGKKLPELSKSIGQSMKELRKGISGDVNDEPKNKDNETKTTDKSDQPKDK